MKAIILYYSKSGNTEMLAERICKDLDCEKLKITPEKEYGNYISAVARVAKEKKTHTIPAFISEIPNLSAYDVVLIGYPVWYQNMPAFVAEFIRQCNLYGKTVIPFATFGTTGVKWTLKTLMDICTGAEIKYPFDYGIFKKDNYNQWIDDIRKIIME